MSKITKKMIEHAKSINIKSLKDKYGEGFKGERDWHSMEKIEMLAFLLEVCSERFLLGWNLDELIFLCRRNCQDGYNLTKEY